MNAEISRLETWNYLLASEIINCWLSNEQANLPNWLDIIKLLGLEKSQESDNKLWQFLEEGKSFSTLAQELEIKIIEETSRLDSGALEKIIHLEEELFFWYYGKAQNQDDLSCLSKIESNFQLVRTDLRNKVKCFVNSFWLKTSPEPCLEYLRKIEIYLYNLSNQYEIDRQNSLKKENGGKKSYGCLVSKITNSPDIDSKEKYFQLASKALLHIYQSKIKVLILTLVIEIIEAIIRDNQIYIENLISTISFLKSIKDSFQSNTSLTSSLIILMLFDHICSVKSPESLKQELEAHLGVPLNRWGSCGYISVEEVRTILLDKVAVLTKDAYAQLASEFNSNSEIDKQESNHLELVINSN